MANALEGLLNSDQTKASYNKGMLSTDDTNGLNTYISTSWFKGGRRAEIMKQLKLEYDKLPPENAGGSGNKERVGRNIEKLNWEIGAASPGAAGQSGLGNAISWNTDTYVLKWEGPDGPETKTLNTDI